MIPDWLQPDFSPAWRTLQGMARDFTSRLPYFLVALAIFLICYFVARRVSRWLNAGAARAGRSANFALLMARLGKFGVLAGGALIAATIAFPTFTPGSLVSLLGLGGVAAGFAFRDILSNLVCGLVLLASEPFRLGDQISVKGYAGEVETIATRATTIRTSDGRRVLLPNTILFNEPIEIFNATGKRQIKSEISAPRALDEGEIQRKLLDALQNVSDVQSEPAPQVLVSALSDSQTTFELNWWVAREVEVAHSKNAVLRAVAGVLRAPN